MHAKKNKRLYAPYICAFCGMVIMNYIMFFLAGSERINALMGGEAIHGTLSFGCVVLEAMSCGLPASSLVSPLSTYARASHPPASVLKK